MATAGRATCQRRLADVDATAHLAHRGDRLPGAETRWLSRIARQTGWPLLPIDQAVTPPTIRVQIATVTDPIPQPDSDESYQLNVNSDGVLLRATTRFGAMRGMETLLQLIENTPEGTRIPWVTIQDKPRFAWRGILIDSARHFMPIRTIKRQIDGIAAARMNVLHWHLTDDQGWRFASSRYPQLQQNASDGLFYTQEEMRDVVQYAAERGVRVVPELDFPGHASALAVAMPELISAPVLIGWSAAGVSLSRCWIPVMSRFTRSLMR